MFVFDFLVNSREYGDTVCSCGYHFFDLRIDAQGTSSLQCRDCRKVTGGIGGAAHYLVNDLLSVLDIEKRRSP